MGNETVGDRNRRLQFLPASTFGEITRKEVEERLHLDVERLVSETSQHRKRSKMNGSVADLARLGILDGGDQSTELVAHGLGGDAGGGCLKIDMGCAADEGIERIALGHEGVGGHDAGGKGVRKGDGGEGEKGYARLIDVDRLCGVCRDETRGVGGGG